MGAIWLLANQEHGALNQSFQKETSRKELGVKKIKLHSAISLALLWYHVASPSEP